MPGKWIEETPRRRLTKCLLGYRLATFCKAHAPMPDLPPKDLLLMTAADSTRNDATAADTTKRRRSWVRSIEYGRSSVTGSASRGFAAYVGRVGALAVALGVGSAVAAMPAAFADTTGSSDSAGASASESAQTATAPNRRAARSSTRAASVRASSAAAIHGVSAAPLSSLGSRHTGDAPAAAPLAWTVAAASRRELGAKTRTATPAAAVSIIKNKIMRYFTKLI
jgi:hypothetical protein